MAFQESISRLVQSLHFKVAAGVIGTVLVLSAIHFAWDYHFYRSAFLFELRQSSENMSDVTLNSLLELAMVGRHPELLQGGVERLSRSSESVKAIQVLDLSGLVRFASDRNDVGIRFSIRDAGCIVCHEGGSAPPRSAFVEQEGETLLRYVAPIPNRTGCHSCHDPTEALTGILLVDHSTGAAEVNLRESLYEMLAKTGTNVLAILLVLGLLLNRVVISRIKRLTAATARLTSENPEALDLQKVAGNDEIGQLARSFEKMALDLQTHCRELEEKERVRLSLLQRLVRSQEEERKTISRELHDQLGQSLSALLLDFQTRFLSDRGTGKRDEAEQRRFEERIRTLIGDVHRLAWQMRPTILDDYGLDQALERYVEETSKSAGISIDFQRISPNGLDRLPHWLETTLYRVAQEGLANVIRHSEATQASVVLMRSSSGVTLLIEDNGVGFDPKSVRPTSQRGLGLIGMKERVNECGGTLEIESAPMRGTTVRAQIQHGQGYKWQSV